MNPKLTLSYVPPIAPPTNKLSWPVSDDYPAVRAVVTLPADDAVLANGSYAEAWGSTLGLAWGFESVSSATRSRQATFRLGTLAESERAASAWFAEGLAAYARQKSARRARLDERNAAIEAAHACYLTVAPE